VGHCTLWCQPDEVFVRTVWAGMAVRCYSVNVNKDELTKKYSTPFKGESGCVYVHKSRSGFWVKSPVW
jgi:hypothetical protein